MTDARLTAQLTQIVADRQAIDVELRGLMQHRDRLLAAAYRLEGQRQLCETWLLELRATPASA